MYYVGKISIKHLTLKHIHLSGSASAARGPRAEALMLRCAPAPRFQSQIPSSAEGPWAPRTVWMDLGHLVAKEQ